MRASTTAAATCRCTSPRGGAAVRRAYEALNDPTMQASIGIFCTPEEVQQQWEDCRRGIVPADPTLVLQIPSVHDRISRRRQARRVRVRAVVPDRGRCRLRSGEGRMGQRVIDKITRLAPNFERSIIRHTLHAQAHGGDVRRARRRLLSWVDALRPDRAEPPRPERLYRPADSVARLYLGSAGCHGGPGITFTPVTTRAAPRSKTADAPSNVRAGRPLSPSVLWG